MLVQCWLTVCDASSTFKQPYKKNKEMTRGYPACHPAIPAKLMYFYFQPLKVVSRYRDPQLQVAENYSYLLNLSTNFSKS